MTDIINDNTDIQEQDPVDPVVARRSYGKVFLVMLLVSLLAAGLLRGIFFSMGVTPNDIMGRVVQAREALPKITAEEQELVMFFGSSMTDAGFSPRMFDREVNAMGKNIKSFNFGFGGLNPYFQDFLSRRIAEQFEQDDKRLKLALIEFNPFQASQTRWRRADFIVDSFITMLASDAELLEIAREDLTRGIRLFTIKYVRGDISAEMTTSFFGRAMFVDEQIPRFQDDEEVVKRRRELGKLLNEAFEREYPDYKGERWSYDWQGAGTIPEERSAETLKLFKEYAEVAYTDAVKKSARARRIARADIEGLHFEPLLVESFIRIVKNFQRFSDRVEVVMLPRNTAYIQYSPETRARLDAAVAQVEAATGLTVRDHQDLDVITPDMFRDASHLARYLGDVPYTRYLIDTYGDSL